ncbi:zinc finger protein MAGPIE-like [Cucurbita maxima]|uniref:Zinc finger protein MAGPIE-like n=1 Tax=Cucurbita maxima TaxID=3661 RepID=A0A6J1J4P8_CUCMA|nr:zinc finger protein MAGPIE-like [Cucurbita maxima]XP_022982382.1 zinc finger protein MAGPIE-like [Cucurbita maxima]XP_022982383.1 zinc finger protein MAGPIE-like [Cucurbita maxima]
MMKKGNLTVEEHSPPPPPPPSKKKRNLPGNPDPDAEVIALSPKALLTTNRFICEICNKGFQRDQNLQLHRRGHNLPWKLKQRSNKEVRKKVYVCPEPTCVHHHPSRALGDLTGIKKHFCRKHGEKKWKCEKCSKRYAVQSDWKAHSKICGTREYRCDCGTLFSRRDSFITHRAFCDALAQESTNFASSAMNNSNPIQPIFSTLRQFPLKTENQDPFYPSTSNILNPFNPNPTSIGFGLAGPGSSLNPVFGSAWEMNSPNMMAFEEPSFEEALNGILMNNRANKDGDKCSGGGSGGGAEEITRDLLGLRALARQPDQRMFENEIVNDNLNLGSSSSSSMFGLHLNHQTQTMFWRD